MKLLQVYDSSAEIEGLYEVPANVTEQQFRDERELYADQFLFDEENKIGAVRTYVEEVFL